MIRKTITTILKYCNLLFFEELFYDTKVFDLLSFCLGFVNERQEICFLNIMKFFFHTEKKCIFAFSKTIILC
jgi:hypothetical protein